MSHVLVMFVSHNAMDCAKEYMCCILAKQFLVVISCFDSVKYYHLHLCTIIIHNIILTFKQDYQECLYIEIIFTIS